MTGIGAQNGASGATDFGTQARNFLQAVGEGLVNAAEKVVGPEVMSELERLLAAPSPLDRFAAPATAPGAAAPRAEGAPADSAGADTSTYTVRAGDTLSEIALRSGVSTAALARANGIANPDLILVGQQISFTGTPGGQAAGAGTVAGTASSVAGGTAGGAPSTGGLSERGLNFIYEHEAQRGVSNHLHFPGGSSGVTLGPGYDMKNRSAADITRDLTAVGVSPADAAKAARGAGLTGSAAREFSAANRGLIDLNPAQERQLLSQTVQSYTDHVAGKITGPVTQSQFDAMVSLAYNIGTPAFDRSTALAKLNAGDTAGAADAMKLFNKSGGQVNQGLVNRRNDEVALFNEGGPAIQRAPAGTQTQSTAPAGNTSASATSPAELAAAIERNGDPQARADLESGKKVVIALRTATDADSNGGKGVYDDTMAVVWKDANGNVQARTFNGNTEPSGQYAFDGPKANRGSSTDLNGDGRKDLGRLQAGSMRYARADGNFLGTTFFRATSTQTAERDINGDGQFNAADGRNVDRSGAGRSMLIHTGGASNTYSAGCQTMARSDYNQFVSALGGQREFSYVLVDAR